MPRGAWRSIGSRATLSVEEPRLLAEEQAALRRVATLVARGAAPEEVFAAVTEEVGQLLPVDFAILGRYEAGATVSVIAAWGAPVASFPLGSRWDVGGRNLVTIVLETGRPARIDRYGESSSGSIGAAGSEHGIRSSAGTPIIVEGQVWGVVIAGSTLEQPLPGDTEARLGSFTELVAAAIANAESRVGLGRLAEEQTALRRVAMLVAGGAKPEEVFAAVTDEVGQLLLVEHVALSRYESDGTVSYPAAWSRTGDPFPSVGTRVALGGNNLATIVFETGRAARMDSYADASGSVADAARGRGFRSAVSTPVLVEGHIWGVIGVGSILGQRLPADTEARLASFTELVATAVANAESRAGLARLAEEQAALRRVATLVARGVPPDEVFAAVNEEVGRLLPVDYGYMGRYEPDGTVTAVAASGSTGDRANVGRRWGVGGVNIVTLVFETGRSGRMDSFAGASGEVGVAARESGNRSSVGTPITVEGRLWGVVVAGSRGDRPLPADTETRLGSFTELVATAIANAESRAALAASRARIVAAGDESRRRIERDLHDGAQQRLVHAVIVLKLALRSLSSGDADAEELVAEALQHAEQASSELRELAHGILPAALTRGGLRAGVDALVSRVSLPVSVDVLVERLPAGVEATAYFVISEALTNVVKHARADGAGVTARVEQGQLRVEVCDDGVGGAHSGDGTGLGGLEDRVAALDGRLVLESSPGGGTRVCALLPVSELR
jgi:signal transduction histidine kinase